MWSVVHYERASCIYSCMMSVAHTCTYQMAQVNSPCKVCTLNLPRPGMHYSGADTWGLQSPLTIGLHPGIKSSNYTYIPLYSYIKAFIRQLHICIYSMYTAIAHSKATRMQQSLATSIVQVCTLAILLEQLQCLIQLCKS